MRNLTKQLQPTSIKHQVCLLLLTSLIQLTNTAETPPTMTTTLTSTTTTTMMPTTTTILTPLSPVQAEALLNNVDEQQLLPKLSLFQLEPSDFYKRMNAGLFSTFNFNSSSFNDSFDYYEDQCLYDQNTYVKFITMILYTLVCIVGLCGNTLVIYVVLRFSKMQTVTNIYILNLAIADECFLIGIPILLFTMQIGSWKFDDYMCKAYMVSTSITQFTSSIFLLIMSADRYIAVCHPISSPRYRTPYVSKIVSSIAWLTSVLLMLPVILFASTVQIDEHVSCNIKWPEAHNTQSGTTFILYTLTLGFATPLTFILGFYFLVIRKLHTVGPKHKSKEKKRSHRKVTRLVLTVITVYIICWLPYWISQVTLIKSSPGKCASRLEIAIFLFVGFLGYSNSAMNPILYAFLSDNFKKSFMKACTCAARKDVNAQLQLENSFFPKFGKNRQSERLISSSKKSAAKHKNALMARNAAGQLTTATMTTTTTSTTGTSGATAITFADPVTTVFPTGSALQSSYNTDLLMPTTTAAGTNATLLVVSSVCTENSDLGSSCASDLNEVGCKPPVLHTNL